MKAFLVTFCLFASVGALAQEKDIPCPFQPGLVLGSRSGDICTLNGEYPLMLYKQAAVNPANKNDKVDVYSAPRITCVRMDNQTIQIERESPFRGSSRVELLNVTIRNRAGQKIAEKFDVVDPLKVPSSGSLPVKVQTPEGEVLVDCTL